MPADPLEGAGPWLFEAPALAPGETWHLNLRNEPNPTTGKVGFFKSYLPMDSAVITNLDTAANVLVTFNGRYDAVVVSDTIEPWDRQGIAKLTVENLSGSATIAAGDVKVEVAAEPFGADDAALERKQEGPLAGILRQFTGVRI